ncbi:outer membrane protein assembly factor BamE [Rubellimicrobium aerolatum]|uniref:Outer membrane protein assembly factor BamE n=1 Tax=Rubellimicrobium aerolatum TaxID=490979 RepID=A0ABW0S610_9RHOB|nr:outer membrane protein assembly factor BamE [Rubellimicrobium aerolatum]MBP1804525.1 outer membrane protein assembly factor BamE (lipoprotein component of BamABCDE complex) [Rubellimicrobium aerolatum]
MRTSLAGAMAVALLLQACAPIVRNHGYVPSDSALATLAPGVDTPESVAAKVGRPTTTGLNGDRSFYYVQSRFQQVGLAATEEVDRQVLAISFAADGTLGNVERFGLEEGRVVPLSRNVTAEVFADRTFINQLLGNVGRFDAGSLLGDDAE